MAARTVVLWYFCVKFMFGVQVLEAAKAAAGKKWTE
jgi:hypothetical protein